MLTSIILPVSPSDRLFRIYLIVLASWQRKVEDHSTPLLLLLLLYFNSIGGLNSPEPPPPDSSPSVSVDHRQLPVQVRDGYLIFQVCYTCTCTLYISLFIHTRTCVF